MGKLSVDEKIAKIREVQAHTISDILNKLQSKNKDALVIRPTGYGKTYMINKIARMERNGNRVFKRVLYVYPEYIIKEQIEEEYGCDSNVNFFTYMFFATIRDTLTTRDGIARFKQLHGDYDLIILDEVHRAGAAGAMKALKAIFAAYPNARKIGVTATYNRADGIDVCTELFHRDSFVFTYTLKDAINDGIFEKLHYVAINYSYLVEAGNIIKAIDASKDIDDATRKEVDSIKREFLINSECINMHQLIKKNINEVFDGTPVYMKFIIFNARVSDMYNKMEEVTTWFKMAYPYYKVNTITIASDTYENRENIKKLKSMHRYKYHIDLIFCVNMLNMGYHVDDITGAILMRQTGSEAVYQQQIGRCMSVTKLESPIIFDMVKNYEMEPAFTNPNRSTSENKGVVVDADFLDLDCVECSDEFVSQTTLLDRLARINSRERIDRAVWDVINMHMRINKAASKYHVRAMYVYKEIEERIKNGTLTEIKTTFVGQFAGVGTNSITPKTVVEKSSLTVEQLAERYKREQASEAEEAKTAYVEKNK